MHAKQVNQFSAVMLMVFALVALATVVSGYVYPPVPTGDEGIQARVFQLAIVLLLPVGVVFLASAEWTEPAQEMRRLAMPAATVALAFAALYYLEHVRLAAR